MGAAARDLNRSLRVLATLATVLLVLWHSAPACRVRAFLWFSLSHGEYPSLPHERERLEAAPRDRDFASLANLDLELRV